MKKNLLTLLVIIVPFMMIHAQSPRFILFEEFTNACCGPCASQNPAFDALLASNTDKCTSIKYHTNWPGADPMNQQNPSEVSTRVSYYSVTGVPWSAMDGVAPTGTSYSGAPANVTQAKINAEAAIPSPFLITINQSLNAAQDSIFVTMLIKATDAVSGNLVAHCAVIEKHIHFATAPGTNGEKDFYNVMKKMLPSASGTALPSSFVAGDYFILQFAWKLANVYDKTQLAVVGFVQDNSNKKVHQAAITTTDPIVAPYQNDIMLSSISNVMASYCQPQLSPVLTIRNNGSEPITSAVIKYKVNNGSEQVYNYSGNLAFLESAVINLPPINYTVLSNNTLKIYDNMVNGVNDEYTKNDTVAKAFTISKQAGLTATLSIKTDNHPEQTTWQLAELDGTVVATGGPYADPLHLYTENLTLNYSKCYIFTIFDSGNDGLCCTSGIGFYKLANGTTTIYSNNTFGSSETTQFHSQSAVGLGDLNTTSVSVYPNPANTEAYIKFSQSKSGIASAKVFNMQGACVLTIPARQYQSGENTIQLDCAKLPQGMYNVQLVAGENFFSQKLNIVR